MAETTHSASLTSIEGKRKTDEEIAAALKTKLDEAVKPFLAVMDEAATAGFLVQWDGMRAEPPFFKHKLVNLRLVKHF